MKKSTYRIFKLIGIFLFLLLFGVFIYVLSKPQNVEQKELAICPDPDLRDFDVAATANSEKRPIGFDYQKRIEEESPDNQI